MLMDPVVSAVVEHGVSLITTEQATLQKDEEPCEESDV